VPHTKGGLEELAYFERFEEALPIIMRVRSGLAHYEGFEVALGMMMWLGVRRGLAPLVYDKWYAYHI